MQSRLQDYYYIPWRRFKLSAEAQNCVHVKCGLAVQFSYTIFTEFRSRYSSFRKLESQGHFSDYIVIPNAFALYFTEKGVITSVNRANKNRSYLKFTTQLTTHLRKSTTIHKSHHVLRL